MRKKKIARAIISAAMCLMLVTGMFPAYAIDSLAAANDTQTEQSGNAAEPSQGDSFSEDISSENTTEDTSTEDASTEDVSSEETSEEQTTESSTEELSSEISTEEITEETKDDSEETPEANPYKRTRDNLEEDAEDDIEGPELADAKLYNMELTWKDYGTDNHTWDTSETEYADKELTLKAQLRINVNYTIAAGDLEIIIPAGLYAYRGNSGISSTIQNENEIRVGLPSQLELSNKRYNSEGKYYYYVISNSEAYGPSDDWLIPLVYKVNVLNTTDNQTFDLKVEAKASYNGEPVNESKTITGKIQTGIKNVTVSKKCIADASGQTEYDGQIFRWSEKLDNRFNLSDKGITQADFNESTQNYYYMEYEVVPTVVGNQPYSM
ncbi:MAG: hypothetical protein ACI4EF_07855, partial [Coprococcus sp.]